VPTRACLSPTFLQLAATQDGTHIITRQQQKVQSMKIADTRSQNRLTREWVFILVVGAALLQCFILVAQRGSGEKLALEDGEISFDVNSSRVHLNDVTYLRQRDDDHDEKEKLLDENESPSVAEIVQALIDDEDVYPYYRSINMTADPNDFGGVQARAFEPWPEDRPLPCIDAEDDWWDPEVQNTATRRGLIFLSLFKTGSTTSSGVHIRMSMNIARSMNREMCKTRYMHKRASSLVPQRIREKSFLWTVIREPTYRAVSQYFYNLYEPIEYNSTDFIRYATASHSSGDDYVSNHYLSRLSLVNPENQSEVEIANMIFENYDFIAITERMEESLVAMATLLRIPVTYVLYLKSNKANGEYSHSSSRFACNFIVPSFVSPIMKEYLRSDDWQDRVYWDHLIYKAANRSLDLTIERLGDAYRKNMEIYRRARAKALEICIPQTVFPCSSTGEFRNDTDCLFLDAGCGNTCLDQVSEEFEQ
jgi:Sulfotransferase family